MIRIKKIKIKNFKCIENDDFDFIGADLVLFDGPNGYGKTSVFDAIEFCFTGEIRRISENFNIDGKVAYEDSPIHRDDSEPVLVSIELLDTESQKTYLISRRIRPATELSGKEKNPKNFFSNADELKVESDSGDSLTLDEIIEYPDIKELYGVLNYVEQDENAYFIKKSAKEKYIGLSKLLGIDDTNKELKKIKKFFDDLKKESRNVEKDISRITAENKEALDEKTEKIEFKILTKNRVVEWDKEEVGVASIKQRDQLLEEVDVVENLVKDKQLLKQAINFTTIRQYALDEKKLTNFMKYYWYTENEGEAERMFRISKIDDFFKGELQKLLDALERKNFEFFLEIDKESLNEILVDKLIREDLLIKSESIKELKKSLNEKGKILESLKSQRDSLIEFFRKHSVDINHDAGSCPLCGFDWESQETLLKQIEITNNTLFESFNRSNKRLEELKSLMSRIIDENEVIKKIKAKIKKIDELNLERLSTAEYSEFESQQKDFAASFNQLIDSIDSPQREEIISLVNELSDNKIPIGLKNKEEVQRILEDSTPKFPEGFKPDESYKQFKRLYDLDFEFLDSITSSDITNKRKYIKFQYLNTISSELEKLRKRAGNLSSVEEKTEILIGIISNRLKGYIEGIISSITAPFYIYTSKILQHHTLGTGLVFNAELNKSSPEIHITPLSRTQEASYSLSSGQLSATVVALMLVLNKVYNKSKLSTILIDDPIQTLDEINTHSLVELLKHNFVNDQIVLSTHEKRYSKFIRYKYEKFGLENSNVSMYERSSK